MHGRSTHLQTAAETAVEGSAEQFVQAGGKPVEAVAYQVVVHVVAAALGCDPAGLVQHSDLTTSPERGYVVVVLTNQDQTMVPVIQRSEALLTAGPSV